jgi:hypothetical protein
MQLEIFITVFLQLTGGSDQGSGELGALTSPGVYKSASGTFW